MNLTPHYILISKIINGITVWKNQLWRFLPIKSIINQRSNYLMKSANKEQLGKKLSEILGRFENFPDVCKDEKVRNNIIKWADQTLAHQFDYLGSGLTTVDPIDWHTDFKSGFRWPRGKFYKKYILIDLKNNSDVKIPWELSRCHHLLWLGEAYLITKDEKYSKEVVDQIEYWISENPLMYSVNWTCTMDVAIRAVNWIFALNMIISSKNITDAFSKKLNKSLFEHGFYIYNNLEKSFSYSGNHYASDLAGLLYIGQFFLHSKHGKRWWQYALDEYFMEIRIQVLPSGVHFERSISYHRLVTELFAYPYFMLLRLGEAIPIDIHYRIRSMFEFVENYIKPDGLSPVIGDNDDGRFVPFIKYDFRDHRYLAGVAFRVFKDPVFANFHVFGWIDSYFLLGQNFENAEIVAAKGNPRKTCSRVYPDAGFAVIHKDKWYLFFNNSGLSRYPKVNEIATGIHTHFDALSFELSVGNDDLIIDPGNYVYTASAKYRAEFSSSRKHNTIIVDDSDQNEFIKTNLFSARKRHEPKNLHYLRNNDHEEIEGESTWHFPNGEEVTHKRSIRVDDSKTIEIQDELFCSKSHTFSVYFHFAPGLVPELKNTTVALSTSSGQNFKMNMVCALEFNTELIDDTISPSYGVALSSKTLKISLVSQARFQLRTIMEIS